MSKRKHHDDGGGEEAPNKKLKAVDTRDDAEEDSDDDVPVLVAALRKIEAQKRRLVFQPRLRPEVSADSPKFTRPLSYRGGPHTENYYRVKDVRSWAQKAMRRSLFQDATFALAMMMRTGFPEAGMRIMGTVVFEDIGLACPDAGEYAISQAYKYKKTVLNANGGSGSSSTRVQPSRAVLIKAAVTEYMRTLLVLLSVPKSRTGACVSPLSIQYTDELLLGKQGELVNQYGGQKWTPEQVLQRWLDAVQKAAAQQQQGDDDKKRQLALAWTNVVYLIATDARAPRFAKEFRSMATTRLLQRAANKKLFTRGSADRETVRAILQCKASVRNFGSERLRWFQSVLMIIAPELCNPGQSAFAYDKQVDKKQLEQCVQLCMQPLGRDLAIPDYVFDKHTEAGKAGDSKTDADYAKVLFKQAEKWGELEQVKKWPAEEIRKSHRAVATLVAMDTSGDDKKKQKDPIGHFFDQGAVVGPPDKCWKNPYHDACRQYYIDYCNAHGGNFQRTKTKFMVQEQWPKLLKHLDLPVEEKKEKKTKMMKQQKAEKKNTKVNEASSDSEEEEDAKIETKTKTKKKNSSVRDDEEACSRDLPDKFPREVVIKEGNLLTADEVARIRKLPWAQMVCGKGSFLGDWMGKKTMHMEAKWCWRGAYDLNKKGAVGDKLKILLMQWRTALAQRMGVHVAAFELFAEKDNPNRVWLRFEQLSPVPVKQWKIEPRVHKQTLLGLQQEEQERAEVQIVDRASCGVVDCYHVDPGVWKKRPDLLLQMMQCNLFKLVCQPICGDVHLGNLVRVGDDKIYAVDLEDFRTKFPRVGRFDKSSLPWWRYAFNRNLAKELAGPLDEALKEHRGQIIKGLDKCWESVRDELTPEQIARARAFVLSLSRE